MPYTVIRDAEGKIQPDPNMYKALPGEKDEPNVVEKSEDLGFGQVQIRYDLSVVTDKRLHAAFEEAIINELGTDSEKIAEMRAKFADKYSTGTYKNSGLEARYKGFAMAVRGILLTEISIQELVASGTSYYG